MKLLPPNKEAEKVRRQKEKAETEALKCQQRIYARRTSSAHEALQKSLPIGARAYADDLNGRWRLSFRGHTKSISWTAAGAEKAAAAAIRQVWAWSVQQGTGDTPAAVLKTLAELDRSVK